MDDPLKLKIAASLDLPTDAAADPDVARAIDADPEARAYARSLHTLDAALRRWPERPRAESSWEALAARLDARVAETPTGAKVKKKKGVSREEADPAEAPVFQDDLHPPTESNQAMSETQDQDADLEGLAALTRTSNVPPSMSVPTVRPTLTDEVDDTSSGIVDIKKLAAMARSAESMAPAAVKEEAKPAEPEKKAEAKKAAAKTDDVMVTPSRAAAAVPKVDHVPTKGGNTWLGMFGGLALAAGAFALYTNTARQSPEQAAAPMAEAPAANSAPSDPAPVAAPTPAQPPPPAAPMAVAVPASADPTGATPEPAAPREIPAAAPAPAAEAERAAADTVVARRAESAAVPHAAARGAVSAAAPQRAPAPTTAAVARPAAAQPEAAPPAARPVPPTAPARPVAATPPPPSGGGAHSVDDMMNRITGGGGAAAPAAAAAPSAELPERPTRSQMTAVLSGLNGPIRTCANGQTGTAPVAIVIGNDGAVRSANVSGQFSGTPIGECIAGVVRRAHFPAFRAQQVNITYPYVILPPRN